MKESAGRSEMEWMFRTEMIALLEKSEDLLTWEDGILQSLPMDEQTRQKCREEVISAVPAAMPYIDA
jgi:hypothetical protein